MKPILLRMDDVGAASKQYEQYAKLSMGKRVLIPPAHSPFNWFGIKRTRLLRGWGPYPELTLPQWEKIMAVLQKHQAKVTLGVTAAWVERDGSLTPFAQKYPHQAACLREAAAAGLIEIANHGLTHCVLAGKKYLPHRLAANRLYHREFWDWVPAAVHREHIFRAQELLQAAFGVDVVTFIPPGHVFTPATEAHAKQAGLKYLSATVSLAPTGQRGGLRYISLPDVTAFHDREIVLAGISWLEMLLTEHRGNHFMTIAEYGAMRDDGDWQ